tara:strand:- start:362 stop:544 length:183 start_codon:yes stop_codon:yes gene_type:complete
MYYVQEPKGGKSAFTKKSWAETYAKHIGSFVLPYYGDIQSLLASASSISPYKPDDDIWRG